MIAVRNKLDDKLRASKYQNRLYSEEFERLLQVAKQRKVAMQKKRKTKAFLI